MMANKSRRAILVCAILAMLTIALGAPTAPRKAPRQFTRDRGRFAMVTTASQPSMS